jgi:hypothetical protein
MSGDWHFYSIDPGPMHSIKRLPILLEAVIPDSKKEVWDPPKDNSSFLIRRMTPDTFSENQININHK